MPLSSEGERVLSMVLIPIHTAGWCNLDKEELMLDTTKIHKLVSILEDADFLPLTSNISKWSSARFPS